MGVWMCMCLQQSTVRVGGGVIYSVKVLGSVEM